MNPVSLPLDVTRLQRSGGRLGSNPAGIYSDDQGNRFYIKEPESPAHARNEYLAAALYQLAGAPTLTYVPCLNPCLVATRWIEPEKKSLAHFNAEELAQARHWLGVHAWTANWDATGLHGDNQCVYQGRVITLDTGGALNFRAQGDPKGKAFGEQVGEINTLRTDADNPHAVKLFGTMNADEINDAVQVVTALADDEIRRVILANGGSEKLVLKMLARKADMAGWRREV